MVVITCYIHISFCEYSPQLTCTIEELPIRIAHRVKELDELPPNLREMPSIVKVKNWYAQSFEVRIRKTKYSCE